MDYKITPVRTVEGLARLHVAEHPVVLTDALALLSAVNFASVVKVLAGLEAIHRVTGTSYAKLVDMSCVPRDHAMFTADRTRAIGALKFVAAATAKLSGSDYDQILQLTGRFPTPL